MPCPSYKLLLADDNPVNREMVSKLLRKKGHTVTAVEDGVAAWEAYQKENFDAILLDIEMPEMDGLETCRKIREHESGSATSIPILALTGLSDPEDRKAHSEAGMNGTMAKPIDIRTINRSLQEYIEGVS
jgi:CheY-like chemotaxis protein